MRGDNVSDGCMRKSRGMAAEVSFVPAGNGDVVLMHPASPDPSVPPAEDVLSLADWLPALAEEIDRHRSEPMSFGYYGGPRSISAGCWCATMRSARMSCWS